MNATARARSIWIRPRISRALLGLAILGAASAGEASAGSIRLHALGIPEKGETTPEYFQRMLDEHVTKITVAELDQGRRTLHAEASGLLPETSFVDYLRWRQTLNVERFDANHPIIAAMLRRDAAVRSLQAVPQELSYTPPIATPKPTPIISGEDLASTGPISPYSPPPTVPEPASGVLALSLIGSAFFARRWARRNA